MPNPHHVLNTSPGKHQILWSVERFEQDQAENLVRAMAITFGADQAVWDTARVLRLPGFRNHKYAEQWHFVRDVHDNPAVVRAYSPQDFPGFPVDEPARRTGSERYSSAATGNYSQSERDWAYVMRELAHGTDPEALRSQLEQSRQDTPNPRYYARRTVARAVIACARFRCDA